MKILLILLICLASLGGLYVGFVFLVASGFIFAGDIDLSDEQIKAARIWVGLGTLFGVFLMGSSLLLLLFSKVIAERILKFFGVKIVK